MTPSNPDNQQSLIYRIADAAGVFHLVAPVDHTHTYADIPGLADDLSELWAGVNEKASQEDMTEALAAKQDVLTFDTSPTANSTNPVTSGGIKAALDGKAPNNYVGTMLARTINGIGITKVYIANPEDRGLVIRFSIEKEGEEELEAEINENNIGNLIRALVSPDATPTTNSDKLVTSGGVKAALDAKRQIRQDDPETSDHAIVSATAEEGDVYIRFSVREGDNIKSASITLDNIGNLIRALSDPDSTPTTNSTNLVTSGGVDAAIKDAQKVLFNTNIPYVMSVVENGILYTGIFKNQTGSAISLQDCFDISTLPQSEQNLYFNTPADEVIIGNGDSFGVRFLRTSIGVYVWYDGLFEY